tara:strand:+ start:189 stop:728 length:540 start_codon:yes stop_codon:yes gene_type:complete
MFQQFVTNKTGYDKLKEFEMDERDAKEEEIAAYRARFPSEPKENNEKIRCDRTDLIVIGIFWSGLLLNSLAQLFTNSEALFFTNSDEMFFTNSDEMLMINDGTNNQTIIRGVLEAIATVLYGVNVIFWAYSGIPCINDSVLRRTECCSCSCRSFEYAICSGVFFAFSIGSTISSFVYLG